MLLHTNAWCLENTTLQDIPVVRTLRRRDADGTNVWRKLGSSFPTESETNIELREWELDNSNPSARFLVLPTHQMAHVPSSSTRQRWDPVKMMAIMCAMPKSREEKRTRGRAVPDRRASADAGAMDRVARKSSFRLINHFRVILCFSSERS